MLIWYKWYCPKDHFQLVNEDEYEDIKKVYCGRCDKEYYIFDGICGEKYESEDFMSHLKG